VCACVFTECLRSRQSLAYSLSLALSLSRSLCLSIARARAHFLSLSLYFSLSLSLSSHLFVSLSPAPSPSFSLPPSNYSNSLVQYVMISCAHLRRRANARRHFIEYFMGTLQSHIPTCTHTHAHTRAHTHAHIQEARDISSNIL